MVMEYPYQNCPMGISDPSPLSLDQREGKVKCPYKVEPRNLGLSEHVTNAEAVKLLLDYLDTEPGYLNATMEVRAKRNQAFIAVGVFGLIAYVFERGKADK